MSGTAQDPLIGTGYRALYLIDQGGMGRVFAAQDPATGEQVAVKIMHRTLAGDRIVVARFQHEAEVLAALQEAPHPNVVGYRTSGQTPDGVPFLVLELLRGRSVAAELGQRGPLPPVEVISILRQALAATAHAHRLGLVHRDLKPENLFLHEHGGRRVVKVLDYGLAKFLGRPGGHARVSPPLTATDAFVGTPRFASAEAAMLDPVDLRSDLYLLGNILGTLLSGRVPFHEIDDLEKVLVAHAMLDAPAPSTYASVPVAAELDRIMLRAVAKEPAERYQTAEEFDAALAQVEDALTRPQGWMDTVTFDASRFADLHGADAPESSRSPAAPIGADRGRGELPPAWETDQPEALPASRPTSSRPRARLVTAIALMLLTLLVATACIALLMAGTSSN